MDTWTLSRYAFFAFLFFLPFQTVLLLREPFVDGEKWQYGVIAIYGTDILLMLAIISAVITRPPWRVWQSRREAWDARCRMQDKTAGWVHSSCIIHHAFLILLVLWAGLSIFWASDQALAGYFFAKLFLGAGMFFLARSLDGWDVKTAMKILLLAAVIQAAIATGQFLWQTSPASTLLGMSAHDAWQAGTSVLKNETGRWLRAYGSFPHPNVLGAFLSAILVVGIGYRIFQTRIKDAGCKIQGHASFIRSHLPYIIYHTSLILILLGLILTFSRTAWLGAAIGIAAYCVFRIRYHVSGKKYMKSGSDIISRPWNYVTGFRGVFGVFLALGAATTVFVFVLRDQVFPRFDATTIERDRSVAERVVSLEDAKMLITEHPIIGAGAGNFTAAIIGNGPDRPIWSVQPAHDVFALVWAELGVVGLLLFVGFVVSVIAVPVRRLWRSIGQIQDAGCKMQDSEKNASPIIYHASFTLGFFTIVPDLFLDHWLWTSHFGIFFLFLLAGLATRK